MHTLDNLKQIKSLSIEINYHFDADETHPLKINSRAFPMGLLIETKLIWTQLIGVNKLRVN